MGSKFYLTTPLKLSQHTEEILNAVYKCILLHPIVKLFSLVWEPYYMVCYLGLDVDILNHLFRILSNEIAYIYNLCRLFLASIYNRHYYCTIGRW